MRLVQLRELLDDTNLNALLVTQADNRYYLSGFSGSAGVLLITKQEAILATDFRYVEQAKSETSDFDIRQIEGSFVQLLPTLIAQVGARRVGFEASAVSLSQFKAWNGVAVANGWELVPTELLVERLRMVKDAQEVEKIGSAVAIADEAFEHLWGFVRPGLTEKEVAWELETYIRSHGAEGIAFDIIVASGPNSALPHARPTERAICRGEPIVIDLGARFEHYCSDVTRTVCLGRGDETFHAVYDIVLRSQAKALEGMRAGMRGQEADALARGVIEEAGYREAFGHGLGHGVGLAIHEGPRVSETSKDVLLCGMTLTVEPGVYLPGWGGVRIEDLVLIEEEGVRVLSQARKDPLVPI